MARRRISFKVAPGIRISASSRGLRTSIGNNSGRVSFGAGATYTSAKVGGIRISQYHSSSGKVTRGGNSRASIAQLEKAQRAATLEAQINKLAAIEHGLVTLHFEEFPSAAPHQVTPPLLTDAELLSRQWQNTAAKKISFFKRSARKTARFEADQAARIEAHRVDTANQQEYERQLAAANHQWQLLLAHEPQTVVSVLDQAFSDNSSEATCIDAGVEENKRYATVVVIFGPASVIPERTPSTTPSGKATTRKRTKTERNALYVKALGSTVLVTVKEAFAVAPSLDEVRMLVLRRDIEASTPENYLSVIYSAVFDRISTNAQPWRRLDPGEQLVSASEAKFQRKGTAGDVVAIPVDEPELAQLIQTFLEALRNQS
ncbi:DUF4236 domain-containing protein [Psychromicrobium sp. YIM B11713]|uniref:DUF4236 domain-containing protein n=1 Tax=Psychromicrobium sp. YIM B11713 TaxID=3145233 RepID=UPI00374E85EB